MVCSLPGSSVCSIFQARVLERVVISVSRGSSQPRYWTPVSCIAGRCFIIWTIREEVDEEDLYTLKINCKGKRTVGKVNKGINVKKYNRFNKLKVKIIKKRKEKIMEEERKKEKKKISTELQKPNVDAEVYNNNRKCNWIYTYKHTPISKIKTVQQK